jgi:ferredoxin
VKRKIISIDEEKCTGCSLCIPNCPEGAIQMIDGKARLISDLFCDGLGACLGHCPEGAITVTDREAEPYNEKRVMENIVKQGENTIIAHLAHLREHDQQDFLREALEYLKENNVKVSITPDVQAVPNDHHAGCPGSKNQSFAARNTSQSQHQSSQLTHWPIQMHLISPTAPQYQGADLLLAADCVAFSLGDFHAKYLSAKALAIACPKLDEGQDVYVQKLTALVDQARVNTITVMIMQVPCCGGLLRLAQQAMLAATRKVPLKCMVVGIKGEILRDEWV